MKRPAATSPVDRELSLAEVLRLHEHLLDLGASLDLPGLYLEILQTCVVLMAADKANLQILDPARGKLVIAAQTGFGPQFLQKFAAIDPTDEHHSVCTRAVVCRRRVFSDDVTNDPEFPVLHGPATAAGFRSVQSTPLFSSAGALLLVVSTHWVEPHRPTAQQEAAMDRFLRQATYFLERRLVDNLRDATLARERSARHDAEELNRTKDQFIATVVHELRQPLAPMLAAIELMKLRVSRERGERARQVIEKQLAQLVRLIEDLMDAARLREGKARLRADRVDLRTIVKDAIDAADPFLRAKGQSASLTAPDTAAWVNVDSARIEQVFTNLLSNASKFSPDEAHIGIAISFEGRSVLVDVQDTGRGIAPTDLPHIFDIFRQATEGESGGLGIGLFIVRGLVELHGGTVVARSAGPGLGSTFAVRLPHAL